MSVGERRRRIRRVHFAVEMPEGGTVWSVCALTQSCRKISDLDLKGLDHFIDLDLKDLDHLIDLDPRSRSSQE